MAILDQDNWRIGNNDSTSPDSCTWQGACGADGGVPRSTGVPFMVRITISNSSAGTGSTSWYLYYNTNNSSDINNSSQVTRISSPIRIVSGSPTDSTATSTAVCAGSGSRIAGEYNDSDNTITNYNLSSGNYTEHQWCVQFMGIANGTYYLFMKYGSQSNFNAYSAGGAEATVAETTPGIEVYQNYYNLKRQK